MAELVATSTALVHAVPGTSLSLKWRDGTHTRVANCAHRGDLSPCAFRRAVIAALEVGHDRFAATIAEISLGSGLSDVGAGLYERAHPCGTLERWIATTLTATQSLELFERFPIDDQSDAVSVALKPDTGLRVTTICMSADKRDRTALENASTWAVSELLTTELLSSIERDSAHARDA